MKFLRRHVRPLESINSSPSARLCIGEEKMTVRGAVGGARFAKTKPWRCFGQPVWGGRVPASMLRLNGRGGRAWVAILMWCFPCVCVVSAPGAFASSVIGMNRVLALGAKRWVVDTAGGYFGRQSQRRGQTPKRSGYAYLKLACIFQRLGVMPRCDRRSDLSASSESRLQLALGSLACASIEEKRDDGPASWMQLRRELWRWPTT